MARDTTHTEVLRARSTGAQRVEGSDSGGGLRKLLPLLLGLLLAILLVALLISLLGGDDDKDGGANGGASVGQLSAGTTKLLPPPAGGLSGEVGKTATGKDVVVQSVNGNEGFFVGSSATDRVYIEWGGDVGQDEASRFEPRKGQKVNLTGPVEPAGAREIARLKLSAADAGVVRSQGAFENAERVSGAQ